MQEVYDIIDKICYMEKIMRLFMLVLQALIATSLLSTTVYAQKIGVLTKSNGKVKVLKKDSIKKEKVKAGYEINTGDLLITYTKASAVIKLLDGSDVVLDKSSQIQFMAENEIHQNGGSIYYNIVKRGKKNSLKVQTEFAIIGIKGTTFIVNDDNQTKGVSLKEGLIGVASLKEEFELHRKKVLEEYERYKMEQEMGFEAFKKAMQEDIVTNVKEFDLAAGKTISFGENDRVDEAEFKEAQEKQFDRFKDLMQSI